MFGIKPRKRPLYLNQFVDTAKPVTEIASRDVVFCQESDSVASVMETMLKRFRKIPVLSAKGDFVGLVSITDVIDLLGGGAKYEIYKFQNRGLNLPVSYILNKDILTFNTSHEVRVAVKVFKKHGRGLYPVVENRRLKAVVTEHDIFQQLARPERESVWQENKLFGLSVEDVMTPKPIAISSDQKVRDVVKMVCRGGFRRLPVTENSILVGMVTPYDLLSYLKNAAGSGKKPGDADMKEVMNASLATIEPSEDLFEAVKLMRDRAVGGLPVTEDQELVGIITERDIIDALVIE